MKSISAILPEGFEKVYNKNKYAKSQKYLKINSQFSLFSSSFSFLITMVIIHFGVFGFLDDFVRAKSSNSIYSGLIFFGILLNSFFNCILSSLEICEVLQPQIFTNILGPTVLPTAI